MAAPVQGRGQGLGQKGADSRPALQSLSSRELVLQRKLKPHVPDRKEEEEEEHSAQTPQSVVTPLANIAPPPGLEPPMALPTLDAELQTLVGGRETSGF